MSVTVRVPTFLAATVGEEGTVSVEPGTVWSVVAELDVRYPGAAALLVDDSGLRRFVNVYVNGDDIRYGAGLDTEVRVGDRITILSAA
jgi:molybdopterin converting factor small subunit